MLNGMLEFGWRDIGRGQILVGVGEVSVTANGTEVARVFSRAGEVLGARVTGSVAAF